MLNIVILFLVFSILLQFSKSHSINLPSHQPHVIRKMNLQAFSDTHFLRLDNKDKIKHTKVADLWRQTKYLSLISTGITSDKAHIRLAENSS